MDLDGATEAEGKSKCSRHPLDRPQALNTATPMATVLDPAFVQLPEHRPKPVIADADSIPTVDLSALHGSGFPDSIPEPVQRVVEEVGRACREWGFFVVVNHGVPKEVVDGAVAAKQAFFALPAEEKVKVRREEARPMGYYEAENTKNVRDWKEVFDFVPHEPEHDYTTADGSPLVLKNRWPLLPGFREAFDEYGKEVEALSFKLLQLIAASLGLPPLRLDGFFDEQTTFIRLNHYPPCPYPELALGVGRHKDAGALTVLYQDDVGGLEVRRQSDGEWVRVKPIPDSFIVNVGDVVQVWTNDRYQSAEHRVSVNAVAERFSIPFFLRPGSGVNIRPLDDLLAAGDGDGSGEAARYKEFNWGHFLLTRVGSNYRKKAVDNIQISDFKILGF